MEIGIYNGGTFNWVSKHVKGKHIAVDIDNWTARNKHLKETVENCHIIIGNSHEYTILQAVEKVLEGELLGLLFIDGDHTEEGVQRDFEMYKHLVEEGGWIVFHDIITSDFHVKCNCYVDRFWQRAPEPKEQVTVSNVWGGVGGIQNRKVKWVCYQIFFDEQTKTKLLPSCIPYDNCKVKEQFYYENDVIIETSKKLKSIKADYVGITSWRMAEKTGLTNERFCELIEATNGAYDVILYPEPAMVNENCIERNKKYYTALYQLCEIIDDEQILPFKMCSADWVCSYANYWLALKEVYKHYCTSTLLPLMKAMKTNKRIKEFIANNPFKHRYKEYPITPFILELLMGFYVRYYNVSHITITKQIVTPDSSDRFKIHK